MPEKRLENRFRLYYLYHYSYYNAVDVVDAFTGSCPIYDDQDTYNSFLALADRGKQRIMDWSKTWKNAALAAIALYIPIYIHIWTLFFLFFSFQNDTNISFFIDTDS